jgi:hypothetical protein
MGLKIFKVFWFFSMAAVLGIFMYVYASLPDPIVFSESPKVISLSKETLFYMALAMIAFTNASVFAVTRILPESDQDFKAWFYGLVACANVFFIVGLSFISLYNSTEKFDYERIGFIIYGTLILLAGWSISWPIFKTAQRFLSKPAV